MRLAIEKPRSRKGCVQCGGELPRMKPSHLRHARFCSRRCWYTWKRDQRPPCPICGNLKPGRAAKTCSAACGYTFRKQRTRKSQRCPVCAAEFWPRWSRGVLHKFCSATCYRKHASKRPAMLTAVCAECGALFRRTTAAIRRRKHSFCSLECARHFNMGPNNYLYRGDHDPNRGPEWRKLAESIRKRDGYYCQRCGRTQEENSHKLSVDHIRPWREFADKALANHPTNLVSLCRRCHSKKTSDTERRWLKGDVLAMKQYERSLKLKPLFAVTAND